MPDVNDPKDPQASTAKNADSTTDTPEVVFAGAGPGAADLITVRALRALESADAVLWAGSLVNIEIVEVCKPSASIADSAGMDLEAQVRFLSEHALAGKKVVRLHSGDPSLYGAIREQMLRLREMGIACRVIPGVTAAMAAAASLGCELTLPEGSQSVVLTRSKGRTPLPKGQEPAAFARTGATLAFYLSAGHFAELVRELTEEGGLAPDTPACAVCRASWPDERIVQGTLADIAAKASEAGMSRQSLLLVGQALGLAKAPASRLYDAGFSHGYRNNLAEESFAGRCAIWACSKACLPKAREIVAGLGHDNADLFPVAPKLCERVAAHWSSYAGHIFVGASGIAVRCAAPLLRDKATDPALVCLDVRGKYAVSLVGGHLGGANRLARRVARITGGTPIITTGTDTEGLCAFDEACALEGMRIANASAILAADKALLDGKPVHFFGPKDVYARYWSNTPNVAYMGDGASSATSPTQELAEEGASAPHQISAVFWDTPQLPGYKQALCIVRPAYVLGVGCRKGVEPDLFVTEASAYLARHSVAPSELSCIASAELKRNEPALIALAAKLDVEARFFSAEALNAVQDVQTSELVHQHTGTGSVSEAASLLAAGEVARLVGPKETVQKQMTFALAKVGHTRKNAQASPEAPASMPHKDATTKAMPPQKGYITVIGLGSATEQGLTEEARQALLSCTIVAGYTPYLEGIRSLLGARPVISSGMRAEIERVTKALDAASKGEAVAVVSSGDAGILAMAGLVYELKFSKERYRDIPVRVVPGVTAASIAAATVGAPLQNGACLVSLSDMLVPAEEVRKNLAAAAASCLPCCLYNPAGKKRRTLLGEALALFRDTRGEGTPCALVRHAGRPEQSAWTGRLCDLDAAQVDMSSLIIIGGLRTRLTEGILYEARGYADKYPELRGRHAGKEAAAATTAGTAAPICATAETKEQA